jgi:hypothetical protein
VWWVCQDGAGPWQTMRAIAGQHLGGCSLHAASWGVTGGVHAAEDNGKCILCVAPWGYPPCHKGWQAALRCSAPALWRRQAHTSSIQVWISSGLCGLSRCVPAQPLAEGVADEHHTIAPAPLVCALLSLAPLATGLTGGTGRQHALHAPPGFQLLHVWLQGWAAAVGCAAEQAPLLGLCHSAAISLPEGGVCLVVVGLAPVRLSTVGICLQWGPQLYQLWGGPSSRVQYRSNTATAQREPLCPTSPRHLLVHNELQQAGARGWVRVLGSQYERHRELSCARPLCKGLPLWGGALAGGRGGLARAGEWHSLPAVNNNFSMPAPSSACGVPAGGSLPAGGRLQGAGCRKSLLLPADACRWWHGG